MFRFVYYEALLAHLKAFGIKVQLIHFMRNITVRPCMHLSVFHRSLKYETTLPGTVQTQNVLILRFFPFCFLNLLGHITSYWLKVGLENFYHCTRRIHNVACDIHGAVQATF